MPSPSRDRLMISSKERGSENLKEYAEVY